MGVPVSAMRARAVSFLAASGLLGAWVLDGLRLVENG